MSKFEETAIGLNLAIDAPPAPPGAYVPALSDEKRCVSAGHLPFIQGSLCVAGKVGADVDLEAAVDAARIATVNCLAAVRTVLGTLNRIERITSVWGYVNATAEFMDHHLVTNGASELILAVFGEPAGQHVRTSVGVSGLPFDAPVEIALECLLVPAPADGVAKLNR